MTRRLLTLLGAALLAPTVASAQLWTGWTAATPGPAGTMTGVLGTTSVSFSGGFSGYQLEDGTSLGLTGGLGNNYWNPPADPSLALPYRSAGVNEPDRLGFIQFSDAAFPYGGTITFGSAVVNPLIAIVSAGQPDVAVTYDFGNTSFTLLSDNTMQAAYWGAGTNNVGVGNSATSITGNEFSGMLQLNGTFTSFSFTTTAENWHGMTVGAVSQVPEPNALALMLVGVVGLASVVRRRRA
jgi:hypothetical protein